MLALAVQGGGKENIQKTKANRNPVFNMCKRQVFFPVFSCPKYNPLLVIWRNWQHLLKCVDYLEFP